MVVVSRILLKSRFQTLVLVLCISPAPETKLIPFRFSAIVEYSGVSVNSERGAIEKLKQNVKNT